MTINTIADQITSLIQTNIVDGTGEANAVNDYRTFPDSLPLEVSVVFLGQGSLPGTTGGSRIFYDFGLALGAALTEDTNDTETNARTADRALNSLE